MISGLPRQIGFMRGGGTLGGEDEASLALDLLARDDVVSFISFLYESTYINKICSFSCTVVRTFEN